MAKILVTGATGHIGANVVREAHAGHHEVTAFCRPRSDRRGIDGVPVRIAEGDVLDRESVDAAMRGVDQVVHLAANFAIWSRDPAEVLRPSIDGTRHVLEAAAKAGVRRVVMASSSAAVGFSVSPDVLRTERDWVEAPRMPYYQAKAQSERLAHEVAKTLGLELTTLCPTLVLGPHDWRVTPSMKAILDLVNGGPTIDGGSNVVSVADVARAFLAALERGEPGERYLVGSENCSLADLGRMIAEHTGRTPRHLKAPRWLLSTMATFMEAGAAITGKPPSMTRAAVHDVAFKYAYFDCSKARTALGLSPAAAPDVVRDTVRWLVTLGVVKPQVARAIRERGGPLAPDREAA